MRKVSIVFIALNFLFYPNAIAFGERPQPFSGDVNGDSVIDLKDAILILKILSGSEILDYIANCGPYRYSDVDGDCKVTMAELIFVLQKLAAIRP